MSGRQKFDPLGWFLSACLTIAIGVGLLWLAIYLLAQVWVWLLVGVVVAAGVLGGGRLLLAKWRQPW